MQRAGGGPAGETAVTESERVPSDIGTLPTRAFAVGEKAVPASAMAEMVAELGRRDPLFVVTNADGNEASNMKAINEALKIRHPTEDGLYNQSPTGQVYEPLSEDACAGFAAGLALFGGRSLWLSYESFAINGWPIVQTVGQAMAELRRKTPALVSMFTAGALEQGRNGWTHQRPEIENYIGGQMRNGNVYLLYPADANQMQAAYGWATEQLNKCISIIASKSALPVYSTPEQAREAIEQGAVCLADTGHGPAGTVVFAVTGDMVRCRSSRPRRPWRPRAIGCGSSPWSTRVGSIVRATWPGATRPSRTIASCPMPTSRTLFDGDALIGVSGGGTVALEPVLLRSRAAARDLFGWQRGETTASPAEIMAFNGITAEALDRRARDLIKAARPALDSAA
jgi:transketolase C-terminal domain/subunit